MLPHPEQRGLPVVGRLDQAAHRLRRRLPLVVAALRDRQVLDQDRKVAVVGLRVRRNTLLTSRSTSKTF